jgi:hypothetical protein
MSSPGSGGVHVLAGLLLAEVVVVEVEPCVELSLGSPRCDRECVAFDDRGRHRQSRWDQVSRGRPDAVVTGNGLFPVTSRRSVYSKAVFNPVII